MEGHCLYLLNGQGLCNRTIYKVKSPDCEEVHWEQFDEVREGMIRDAFIKIKQRNKPVNEQSLREELDMGPKEWGKFGGRVLKFVRENLNEASFSRPPSASKSKRAGKKRR